jgi:ATP-dependent Clp protease ATP-binding subunit ClpC
VFERFTERARHVVILSQDEARALQHNYIGTEHLLLGLVRAEEGLASRVLVGLGVTLDEARTQVARVVGQGDEITTGQIPFTPRAKRVLELSINEGLSLGHNYVGTEHLLLGLVRENEGVASHILRERFDLDADEIRNEIIRMLSGSGRRKTATDSEPAKPGGEVGRTVAGSMVQTHTVRHVVRRLPRRPLRNEWRAMATAAGLLSVGVIIGRVIWG